MCHLGGEQNEDSLSMARCELFDLVLKSKPKAMLPSSPALDSQTTENSASSRVFQAGPIQVQE